MSVWDDDAILPMETLQECLAPEEGEVMEEGEGQAAIQLTVAGTLRQMCVDVGAIPFRAAH